jgi:REP element-mobilizing transposase RayT
MSTAPESTARTRYPDAYLITVRCYGMLLPGEQGCADLKHNLVGSPSAPTSGARRRTSVRLLRSDPYSMDEHARAAVLGAIREVCEVKDWKLWACHVRGTHWHAVVTAQHQPELVMRTFKAYASRALNFLDGSKRPRWVRHGSTRYLWAPEETARAMRYVVDGQGDPMAVHQGL